MMPVGVCPNDKGEGKKGVYANLLRKNTPAAAAVCTPVDLGCTAVVCHPLVSVKERYVQSASELARVESLQLAISLHTRGFNLL